MLTVRLESRSDGLRWRASHDSKILCFKGQGGRGHGSPFRRTNQIETNDEELSLLSVPSTRQKGPSRPPKNEGRATRLIGSPLTASLSTYCSSELVVTSGQRNHPHLPLLISCLILALSPNNLIASPEAPGLLQHTPTLSIAFIHCLCFRSSLLACMHGAIHSSQTDRQTNIPLHQNKKKNGPPDAAKK